MYRILPLQRHGETKGSDSTCVELRHIRHVSPETSGLQRDQKEEAIFGVNTSTEESTANLTSWQTLLPSLNLSPYLISRFSHKNYQHQFLSPSTGTQTDSFPPSLSILHWKECASPPSEYSPDLFYILLCEASGLSCVPKVLLHGKSCPFKPIYLTVAVDNSVRLIIGYSPHTARHKVLYQPASTFYDVSCRQPAGQASLLPRNFTFSRCCNFPCFYNIMTRTEP